MEITRLRCQAMIDAGVNDPASQEGIDFCVERCPYEEGCILFDSCARDMKPNFKATLIKRLFNAGVSRKDIALITHSCKRTIDRYLAK